MKALTALFLLAIFADQVAGEFWPELLWIRLKSGKGFDAINATVNYKTKKCDGAQTKSKLTFHFGHTTPQAQFIHQHHPMVVNEEEEWLEKGEERVANFTVNLWERMKVCCKWYSCNDESVYTQTIFHCIFYSNLLFIEKEHHWLTFNNDWEPEFIHLTLAFEGQLYRSYFTMPFYCDTGVVEYGFYSVTAFSRCPPVYRENGNLLYQLYAQ